MTSILTNNGAMVALQTLQSINNNLTDTQNQISTGKRVAHADDNAAVWAISKVMESDVSGFEAISDSLNLGEGAVNTAQTAAESIQTALEDIKDKIIAAQDGIQDRGTLQDDIDALKDQITSITSAAQFNGVNLLSNTDTTAGSGTLSVLSSLDRASDGTVTASNIDVKKQDLGQSASAVGTTAGTDGVSTVNGAVLADGATASFDMSGSEEAAQVSWEYDLSTLDGLTGSVSIVMRDGDTTEDAVEALAAKATAEAAAQGVTGFSFAANGAAFEVTNNSGAATTGNIAHADIDVNTDGTIGGGLEDLATIDVTSDQGATDALSAIEGLIQTAVDAAAAFGSSAGRIENQSDFVSKLTDSLKSGIGAMVDTDMEAASARLKALQTQQSLGVQALSIANSAPQTLQQLFR